VRRQIPGHPAGAHGVRADAGVAARFPLDLRAVGRSAWREGIRLVRRAGQVRPLRPSPAPLPRCCGRGAGYRPLHLGADQRRVCLLRVGWCGVRGACGSAGRALGVGGGGAAIHRGALPPARPTAPGTPRPRPPFCVGSGSAANDGERARPSSAQWLVRPLPRCHPLPDKGLPSR
jgi:hypothetical protein